MTSLLLSDLYARAAARAEDEAEAQAERDERKREIQAILDGDDALRTEIEQAKDAREQQDRRVSQIEDDPTELARVGHAGYAEALQQRTHQRMALGKVLLRQSEFRQQNDIGALRGELAGIISMEDDDARQRARAVLVEPPPNDEELYPVPTADPRRHDLRHPGLYN
jgi:hypothetical protein